MSSKSHIQQAAEIIGNGGVISYPTESVFGLGCDPLNEAAVQRILKLKNRSVDKGLIIVAGILNQLMPYIEITDNQKEKILNENHPTTWLVKKSKLAPHWISGKHSKIAIRISQHPTVINVCHETNHPIISTSANPSNAEPAITCQQSRDYFKTDVDLYLDDSTKLSKKPTPIKDIETGAIIR